MVAALTAMSYAAVAWLYESAWGRRQRESGRRLAWEMRRVRERDRLLKKAKRDAAMHECNVCHRLVHLETDGRMEPHAPFMRRGSCAGSLTEPPRVVFF